MDKIKGFNECFFKYGGWFDLNKLEIKWPLELLLNFCKDEIAFIKKARPNLPEIYIDFISNSQVGAVAGKYKGNYYIGINIGTFFVLSHLFNKMLASKDVLTDFGDVSKEIEHFRIYNARISDFNTLQLVIDPNDRVVPVDETRSNMVHLLMIHAFLFLTDHEIAHIAYGHVDLIGEKTSSFNWSEIGNGKTKGLDFLAFQTLEMDADSHGANRAVDLLRQRYENFQALPSDLKVFYSSVKTSFKVWYFSIYSLFKIFSFGIIDNSKLLSETHPPIPIRQRIVASTIVTVFIVRNLAEQGDVAAEGISEASFEAEKAFSKISEQEFSLDELKASLGYDYEQHMMTLSKNWNVLRPQLEKYAFLKLAPLWED